MKETVHIINQYGQHLIIRRTIYDFSGRKCWTDRLFELFTWSGFLTILAFAAALFI